MSVILTDQGFVEIGGELTHWDRGYIKKGHKWITRKMKNGKWVYTYKKAKDLKDRAEKARKDLKFDADVENGNLKFEKGKLSGVNIDQYMKLAIENHAFGERALASARKQSAKSHATRGVKDTKAREKLINTGVSKLDRHNYKVARDSINDARRDYQTAEDLKRMQNSARRTVQKENATHVVKNKINDWLEKRRKNNIKVTYSTVTLK